MSRVGFRRLGSEARVPKSSSPNSTDRRQQHPSRRKTWLTSLFGPNRWRTGATSIQSENQVARTKATSRSPTSGCRWASPQRRSRSEETNFGVDPYGELGRAKRTDCTSPSVLFLEMEHLPQCSTRHVVVARP